MLLRRLDGIARTEGIVAVTDVTSVHTAPATLDEQAVLHMSIIVATSVQERSVIITAIVHGGVNIGAFESNSRRLRQGGEKNEA